MQRTSSSWPSKVRRQAPASMSQRRMELSEEPETTMRSRYCRQAMPRLCPFRVRTNSQLVVFQTWVGENADFGEQLAEKAACMRKTGQRSFTHFDRTVTGCGHNVLLIEVHDVYCRSMADEHPTQRDLRWRHHIPHSDAAVLGKREDEWMQREDLLFLKHPWQQKTIKLCGITW